MREEHKPEGIVSYRVTRRQFVFSHRFCFYCGKELTKFDFKTGNLFQEQHFVGKSEEGVELRFCWSRHTCVKRRKERLNHSLK